MSAQYTAGRFQAFDSSGDPLSSGRLYTYSSGTTTHKNAYTSATLATPVTYTSDGIGGTYIALDARGEAELWLGYGEFDFSRKQPQQPLKLAMCITTLALTNCVATTARFGMICSDGTE